MDWSASRTHSNCIVADRKFCLGEVEEGLIGFICDIGIAGADINFNLVVGKRLDTLAVDVGGVGVDVGGVGVDVGGVGVDVVFVSTVNADMIDLYQRKK